MATNLYNARLNYILRIEAIVPTVRGEIRFRNIERSRRTVDPETGAMFALGGGAAREFYVVRAGSGQDRNPTCAAARWSDHSFLFTIAYPPGVGNEDDIHKMMDNDRDQIIDALELKSSMSGITGDASASTGIIARYRLDDAIDDTGAVWTQTYRYVTRIKET